jgi:hypothetical protein
VTFQHKFDLEDNNAGVAYDGVALEIAMDSGPFQDIGIAGGSFALGGYNSTVSGVHQNPLAGRDVWSGSSAGFQRVEVNLPADANGRTVKLRWRMGTDVSVGGAGYWLDDIRVYGATAPTFPPDETFDELTAPELPLDWINNVTSGPGPGWITTVGDNGTLNAYTDDTATVSDKALETPRFDVVANGRVWFQHKVDLEIAKGNALAGVVGIALDGVVLEIAYGDGPFVDVVEAGGTFVFGGYNNMVRIGENPLSGRAVWSGSSAGYEGVLVNLPAAANGRSVRLRWRVGTDSSVGRTGYALDAIHVDLNGAPAFPPDETFDDVTVPALPYGWTSTNAGAGNGWFTLASEASSAPNAAYTDDPPTPTDRSLMTPLFLAGPGDKLSFRHKVDLDASNPSGVTFDGVVLEISIAGGQFQDIFAAGGSFSSGGYDRVVFASPANPLSGRNAWGGDSNGYRDVVVNLPQGIASSAVRMRWRLGTDEFAGGRGYWLDDIHLGVPISDRIFFYGFECRPGQACP